MLGDLLALLSVVMYSVYTSMIKAAFPTEDDINTLQLYGVVGLAMTVMAVPATLVYLGFGFGTLQGITLATVAVMVLKGATGEVRADASV